MYSPKLEDFQKLAAQGNLIPVTRRLLADIETPLSAYRKIQGAGESFLFESVEGGEHLGRYSFVGCNPRAVIRQTGNRVELIENGKVIETFTVEPKALTPSCCRIRVSVPWASVTLLGWSARNPYCLPRRCPGVCAAPSPAGRRGSRGGPGG